MSLREKVLILEQSGLMLYPFYREQQQQKGNTNEDRKEKETRKETKKENKCFYKCSFSKHNMC